MNGVKITYGNVPNFNLQNFIIGLYNKEEIQFSKNFF